MALDREVALLDEVLDLVSGSLVRPEKVARVRDYLDNGGTWHPEAVAESILDDVRTGRHA